MKRTGSPIQSTVGQKRRQDPVSCSHCRSKKLKCNRESPCSNCSSRGLRCDLPPIPAASGRPAEQKSTKDHVLADILTRLQRLERAVLDATPSTGESGLNTGKIITSTRHASPEVSQYWSDPTSDQAFAAVETTITRDDALSLAFADTLEFDIRPALDIHRDILSPGSRETSGYSFSNKVSLHRQVLLPIEQEALSMFDEYIKTVGSIYHVLHFPTTRKLFKSVYTRLGQPQEKVPRAHIALVLAVIATGAFFWTPESASTKPLFPSMTHSEECSMLWTKWTLDVLENNRRTVYPTVEDLQATILICHITTNVEGFTARARSLHSTAHNMAREMGLHLVDSPRNRFKNAKSDDGHIALEVKRRLWWYIVFCDWLMCNIPGPHEGFYSIRPNQFCVNRPLNIWDEDLTDDAEPTGLPLSQPTDMSYNIVRNIAADLARRICDAQPNPSSSMSLISAADLTVLESYAQESLSQLPCYFRFDMEDDPEVRALHTRYPFLTQQRAVVNLGINLGTLHLHRPYLFCRAGSPMFSDSRKACLHAARQIIATRSSMDDMPSNLARNKISFITHHVFTAVLVLALDLCFNSFPSEADREARRVEVKKACDVLDDRRNSGTVASRYLAPLLDTLRRHRVQLYERDSDKTQQDTSRLGTTHGMSSSNVDQSGNSTGPSATTDIRAVQDGHGTADANALNWPAPNGMATANGSMGSMLWQDILDFPALETTPDWEQLFADLNATYAF